MSEVKPIRLRLSRAKGFNLQDHSRSTNGLPAINVARPSVWGNPFVIGAPSGCGFEDGGDPTPMVAALTRAQVVEFYQSATEGHLKPEMHPHGHQWLHRFRERYRGMSPTEAARSYLKGRNLACRCEAHESCHADVLLELANDPSPNRPVVPEERSDG